MVGSVPGASPVLAFFGRPSTGVLLVAVLVAAVGWGLHMWAERSTRAPLIEPGADRRPPPLPDGGFEPPAVVGVLTNGYDVPREAITATAIDLAARGWVRFAALDGELVVVTRAGAAAGDSLRPFEQQVLNHLASRSFNDVISAGTLAASQHRLDRRWRTRFARSVAATSISLGLTTQRYTPIEYGPPAAAAGLGLLAAWAAARGGEDVAISESWQSRSVWLIVIAALLALGWLSLRRATGSAQRPTDAGAERTVQWLGFRHRLRDRIPPSASVIASSEQQVALSQAVVMGVAEQVFEELPVVLQYPRAAWSEAGGVPHVVSVRYPIRPGYGQHPVKVAVTGLVVLVIARWLQGYLARVSDGEALESLIERLPGQVDLVETVAGVMSVACWVPIVWGGWSILAGSIDSVASRERIGSIVRARRPVDVLNPTVLSVVRPFAERDRFTTYIAVDDGNRSTVTAWLAGERSTAPQGAHARVRATPILGYVRSSDPVGTATRRGS